MKDLKLKTQNQRHRRIAAAFLIFNFALLISARATSVSLTTDDVSGSTSFNAAGNWSSAAAPAAGNSYFNNNFLLRTPATTTTAYTFAGDALTITSASAVA